MTRDARGRMESPPRSSVYPWRINPSSWAHRGRVAVVALIGFGIASYLALYQWGIIDQVWDPFFGEGSEQVLDSNVSHRLRRWILVPDAALGAFAYLGDALYGLAGTTRRWQYRPWLVTIFGLDVIPLGLVGAILVFLQGAVVGAFCTLCIASAVVSLALVVMAWDEVWSSSCYLLRVFRASHDRRILWRTFCGKPSQLAATIADQMVTEHYSVQEAS